MAIIEAICPSCHATNRVGDELIGRYTLCDRCRCRFYVTVPPLGEAEAPPALREPGLGHLSPSAPASETTLDELLWDTQQGSKFIIRSLRRQERAVQRLTVGLIVIGLLVLIQLLLTTLR